MKIKNSQSSTSFYETFSDLIFATMAIFVLLMIIFLVQVQLDKGIEEIEAEIKEKQEQLEVTKKELKKEEKSLKKKQQSKASLQSYNFEIVIAVDTTGSMQSELDLLTDTMKLVAKILPKIAKTVKIGVIGYRKDENNRSDIQVFSMQVIKATDKDNFSSYTKLNNFVRRLRAKKGSAPFSETIDKALAMFSDTDKFTGHQTLMILGDVGPYEDFYRDQKIDAKNKTEEKQLINKISQWSQKSDHRNLLVLFSGEDEIRKTASYGGSQHKKYLASKEFFNNIAVGAKQPKAFSTNTSDMIPLLLSAILN